MSSKITAALIDLSGTLHIEDTVIPGAIEALRRLRQSGIQIRFVSNTTKEPLRTLHDRLSQLGFDIRKEAMFTSLSAARNLVDARSIRPFLMLEETAKEDFAGVDEVNPNAVVIGLAPSKFNYETMDKAFRLLLNGAQLIAIHKGRYYQKKDGLSLGPGPFVAGLEYASGVKAEIVGKPEKSFFDEALRMVNSAPSTTVMIGDDVKDDVAGAMSAGLLGILVKTGKYREGDEATISPGPSSVCNNFSAAVDLLLKDYLK